MSRCKRTHKRPKTLRPKGMTPRFTSKSLVKEFHEKTKAMLKQEHAAAPGKASHSVLEILVFFLAAWNKKSDEPGRLHTNTLKAFFMLECSFTKFLQCGSFLLPHTTHTAILIAALWLLFVCLKTQYGRAVLCHRFLPTTGNRWKPSKAVTLILKDQRNQYYRNYSRASERHTGSFSKVLRYSVVVFLSPPALFLVLLCSRTAARVKRPRCIYCPN